MATSTTFTAAQAYRDYAEEVADKLLGKAYYGAKTLEMVTLHDNVKGKKILTQLILGDLGRRYAKTFAPVAGMVDFVPRELETFAGKFEYSFSPQDFESSYLGDLKRTGFNNVEEFPMEEYILMKIAERQSQEIERAIWRGVAAGSPASTDKLWELFDGWLEKLKDAITATDVTPYTTPGGAWTTSNIVAGVEAIWDLLDPEYQEMPLGVFMSPKLFKMYNVAYRDSNSKYVDAVQAGRRKLDFCEAELIRVPGMGTSNRIIITPVENLHVGYDDVDERGSWHFEQNKREIDMWADFKLGVEFGFLEDGIVSCNDLV